MENVYKSPIMNRILALILGPVLIFVGAIIIVIVQGLSESPGIVLYITGGAFALIGLLVFYGGLRPSYVAITDEALEVRTGNKVNTRFPYAEMRGLHMVSFSAAASRRTNSRSVAMRAAMARTKVFPKIEVENDSNKQYFIELPYIGRYIMTLTGEERGGRFSIVPPYDSQTLVADLLSRLPSHVNVDPFVAQFAQTGELPDATTLPKGRINTPFGQI